MGDQRGAALPVVLLAAVVVALLGLALWHYSMLDLGHVTRDESRMKAHYLARSGAQLAYDLHHNSQPLVDGDLLEIQFMQYQTINVLVQGGVAAATAVVDDVSVTLRLDLTSGYWER